VKNLTVTRATKIIYKFYEAPAETLGKHPTYASQQERIDNALAVYQDCDVFYGHN
jgi:hypothetical protein